MIREALGQYKTRDRKSLYFRKWQGAGSVIIYLHGIESNSGWFLQIASRLCDKGFTIYGIDRRGSGLNRDSRGDIKDYNTFFDDIEDALTFAREQNIGKKIYLLGICWGAFLAVNYALRNKSMPDGLILLSPAIYRRVDLGAAVKIAAKTCSLFCPKVRFSIPIRDQMFTDNPRYRDFIKSDDTRLRSLTSRFFNQILRLEADFESIKKNLSLPVIIMLAGHDKIVDNGKVKKWFNEIISRDKVTRMFEDFHHVMPFGKNITPLISCINDWVKEREAPLEGQSIKN